MKRDERLKASEGVRKNTQAKHSTPPSSTANALESTSSSKRRSKKQLSLLDKREYPKGERVRKNRLTTLR
ncbi:MAG: hypothetical protein IKT53_08655 [Bacteroidaceae bacterium]|nr:hypothetical protein [Bacteroidaceae bacterium]